MTVHRILVVLVLSLLLAACGNPSQQESLSPQMHSSTSSSPESPSFVYSVQEGSHMSSDDRPEWVQEQLVATNRATGSSAILVKQLNDEWSGGFEILYENADAIYMRGLAGPPSGDFAVLVLLKYNITKRMLEHTTLEDHIGAHNGDLRQIGSSALLVWAPFMDGGFPIDDRTIYLLDLEKDTSSIVVSLPETETLNGADPCDRGTFITDISVSDHGVLRYAVYSQEKITALYPDVCNYSEEQQQEKAAEAFLEYRTLDLSVTPSTEKMPAS